MSLRARLLVGLVVLVAAGLLVAGIVTYTAERSFLVARVDQQVAGEPISSFEDSSTASSALAQRRSAGHRRSRRRLGGGPRALRRRPGAAAVQPGGGPARPLETAAAAGHLRHLRRPRTAS